MTTKRYLGPDPDETRLRATIELLGREIAGVTGGVPIEDAFRTFVRALDLAPLPAPVIG